MLYTNPDGDRLNLKGARCEGCNRLVNALTGTLVLLSDGLRCPACMRDLDPDELFLQAEGAMTLEPALFTV